MKKPKKRVSGKEKRRLRFVREQKEQRNIAKQNFGFSFPKKQDIRFKSQEPKK